MISRIGVFNRKQERFMNILVMLHIIRPADNSYYTCEDQLTGKLLCVYADYIVVNPVLFLVEKILALLDNQESLRNFERAIECGYVKVPD